MNNISNIILKFVKQILILIYQYINNINKNYINSNKKGENKTWETF
jgi:hypothetical protein